MATAVKAIERRAAFNPSTRGRGLPATSPEVDRLCAEFEIKLQELKRLKSVDARRAFALKTLAPFIDRVNELSCAHAKMVDSGAAWARSQAIYDEQVDAVVEASDWKDGGRNAIADAMPYNQRLAEEDAKWAAERELASRSKTKHA
jgi:hypothetical protein